MTQRNQRSASNLKRTRSSSSSNQITINSKKKDNNNSISKNQKVSSDKDESENEDRGIDLEETERPTTNRVKFDLNDENSDSNNENSSDNDDDLLNRFSQNNDGDDDDDDRKTKGFLKSKSSSDSYFLSNGRPNPTSQNLFSDQSDWRSPIEISDYLKLRKSRESQRSHPSFKGDDNFEQWATELVEGYSLVFYGIGSKRETLNRFLEDHLVKSLGWEGLIVNGFQSNFNLINLIGDLEEIVYGIDNNSSNNDREEEKQTSYSRVKNSSSTFDQIENRVKTLCESRSSKGSGEASTVEIAVLIHNLDGPNLRNSRTQSILSMLAAKDEIHLIGSIDHVHAPILLPHHLSSTRPEIGRNNDNRKNNELGSILPMGFNFLYHHLSTKSPYTIESLLSGSVSNVLPSKIFPKTILTDQQIFSSSSRSDVHLNGPTTPTATLHVLASLTEKSKSLFKLIASNQMHRYKALNLSQRSKVDELLRGKNNIDTHNDDLSDDGTNQNWQTTPIVAIRFKKLFELARSEFIASVESQLEALLVEFRDHNIILGSFGSPDKDLKSSASVNNNNDTSFLNDCGNGFENDEEEDEDEEWLWIGLCKDDLESVIEQIEEL